MMTLSVDIWFVNLGLKFSDWIKSFKIGNFDIYFYGCIIAFSVLLALTVASIVAKKTGQDPDTYAGKKIRMKGFYYAAYYEPTDTYYHYGVIQDALACCQQGLEFVWGDGSHVYPDEYPAEETEIYVTGTFETYQEEGDLNLYCHLKDAKVCWYE